MSFNNASPPRAQSWCPPYLTDAQYLGRQPFAIPARAGGATIDYELAATFSTIPWQDVEREIVANPHGHRWLHLDHGPARERRDNPEVPVHELPGYVAHMVEKVRAEADSAMRRHTSKRNTERHSAHPYVERTYWFTYPGPFVTPDDLGPDSRTPSEKARDDEYFRDGPERWQAERVAEKAARVAAALAQTAKVP